MSRQHRTLCLVFLGALGLAFVRLVLPQGLYSFHHHANELYRFTEGLLGLLAATHASLCLIMWAQRDKWDSADSSIFRFIAVKALFWGWVAATEPHRSGINLSVVYLFGLILISTVDLDIQLVRRYVIVRREDAKQEGV